MCIRVIEKYATCGCVYHFHAVDACRQYGRHPVQDSIVLVGYSCPDHSGMGGYSGRSSVVEAKETSRSSSDARVKVVKSTKSTKSTRSSVQNKPSPISTEDSKLLVPPQTSTIEDNFGSETTLLISKPTRSSARNTSSPISIQKPQPQVPPKTSAAEESSGSETTLSVSKPTRLSVRNKSSSASTKKPQLPLPPKTSTAEDTSSPETKPSTSKPTSTENTKMDILSSLASDEVLKHLWPQVCASQNGNAVKSEIQIRNLLRKYGEDLQVTASRVVEMKASRLVRSQVQFLSHGITQKYQDRCKEQEESEMQQLKGPHNDPERDSDVEFDDDRTSERFEDIKEFCFKGKAFLNLRFNVESFLIQLTTQGTPQVLDRILTLTSNLIDRLTAKEIPRSATRLVWTCSCGRRIVDDYVVNKPEALLELQMVLSQARNVTNTTNSSPSRQTGMFSTFTTGAAALTSAVLGTFKSRSNSLLPKSHTKQTNILSKCPDNTAGTGFHNYVLLCIPFMRTASKMTNTEICRLQSDRDFFRLLRWCYNGNRGRMLSRISLKKVTAFHFVQFEMYANDFADIQTIPSLPPETAPGTDAEYSYSPMPPAMIPPIGPNLLLHFYEHPSHASVLPTLLAKIPKKLKAPLAPCPVKGSSVGWGIQIHEGFHWFVFFGYCVAAFLGCIVVGGVWAGVKGDVQGGFGVAGFLMTGVAILGGLVHTRAMM